MAKDEKKKKFKKVISPKGKALYAYLKNPDRKFEKQGADPKYKIQLVLDKEADSAFLEAIDKWSEKAFQDAQANKKIKPAIKKALTKHVPYEDEYDKEGDETGNVIVKFACNVEYKNKETGDKISLQPKVFGAGGGKPLEDIPLLGNGSIVKVACNPIPFVNSAAKNAGVSLRLQAVQILKLETFEQSAEDYGFGDESDDDMDMPWDQEDGGDTQADEDGDF